MRSFGFSSAVVSFCLTENGPGRPSSRARRPRSQRSVRIEKRVCRVAKRNRSPVFWMYARSYCFTIAVTRLRVSHGGLDRRPEKYMLYSASSRFSSASSRCKSRSIEGAAMVYRGIRNHTSGNHSSRAYGIGRSSIKTSVESDRPTISNRSRRRAASVHQNRARWRHVGPAPVSRYSAEARASSRARPNSGTSRVGNTSVMENGRGLAPKRASWRSGSSDASSASVGCSGRSAYGQKRSVGRNFGESGAIDYLKGDSPRGGLRLGESIAYHSVDGGLPPHPLNRQASTK